jgi:adenine-specific DNA-methyltransferase
MEPTVEEPQIVEEVDEPVGALGSFLWWAGRRQSSVAVPKPRILEETPEHSDPTDEDPGNLMIEGDNRQAMVSLLPQYGGKVDVVLIDPPYNTGKRDFRYNDSRFQDPDADTARGDFVATEDGGKHTKWLNQMAPTLRIIRELMASHGVIFIHIDDRELPRLLLLMEEIFDERNRIGMVVKSGRQITLPRVRHDGFMVRSRKAGQPARRRRVT